MAEKISKKVALLVIDVQNDFISGSLALKDCPAKQDGEEIIAVINQLKKEVKFDLVVYSLDWHPKDHCSFLSNVNKYPIHKTSEIQACNAKLNDHVIYDFESPQEQILWPDHCVQESDGAKLHHLLEVNEDEVKVKKGTNSRIDSYSAFWDNGKLSKTELYRLLCDKKITTCFVCGLATDFCVQFTCLDCAQHGFKTYIIEDACRGVSHELIEDAKEKMIQASVEPIQSDQ
eukprot:gene3912-4454_t